MRVHGDQRVEMLTVVARAASFGRPQPPWPRKAGLVEQLAPHPAVLGGGRRRNQLTLAIHGVREAEVPGHVTEELAHADGFVPWPESLPVSGTHRIRERRRSKLRRRRSERPFLQRLRWAVGAFVGVRGTAAVIDPGAIA